MQSLYFWKNWNAGYKAVYSVLLFVFIASIVASAFFQLYGTDFAMPLEKVRKTQSINISLHDVDDFVFNLPIPARNYIILQGYLAPTQSISISWGIIYLIISALVITFMAAAATYFSRLWFLFFQTIFVLWIITFKIPFLSLFGVDGQWFNFLFVGLFLAIGYYFHAYKTEASLFVKWISFLLLTVLIFGTISFGTEQQNPLHFVAQHATIIPILLTAIFIGNVAYEVLLHVVYLLTSRKTDTGRSNLGHFLVLSLLYLCYVGLTFARNAFFIKWDIIYLDEFFLLTLSAILGIWGFKKRSELLSNQLSFAPLGAYLYLVLGTLSFATLSWIFITANDPLIDTFEDVIIFTHLGFGILFFLYVLSNFTTFLMSGVGIYKVVFKPIRIPYNLVRFVGLGLVIVMVLRVSYTPYFQALAGYYSAIADYYTNTGKEDAAVTSYKIAKQYATTTHKPNYNLGAAAFKEKNWAQASFYFGRANYKRPTVQAFMNRAQAQLNANLVFEALFTLQDAQKQFPDNAYLLNMEGLVYEQLGQVDSSFLYFDAARRATGSSEVKDVALANKMGLFAKNNVQEELPDINFIRNGSVPLKANFLALSNMYRKIIGTNLYIEQPDSALTYNDFSLLFNQVANTSLSYVASDVDIQKYSTLDVNEAFQKSLSYVQAVNKNYAGKQLEAFSLINDLQSSEISDAGFYYLINGFWLMDQGAFNQAVEKFERAEKLRVSKATTYLVLALVNAGRLYEAARIYEKQFAANTNTVNNQLLNEDPLYLFLQGKTEELPNDFLYLWLKTNDALTAEERAAIQVKLSGSYFEKLAELDSVKMLIKLGDYERAGITLSQVQLAASDDVLLTYKNNLLATTIAFTNKKELFDAVDEEALSTYPKNYNLLFNAYRLELKSDSNTPVIMEKLGSENVYFEEGVLYAAKYFVQKNMNEQAYELLVDAARLNTESTNILKAYTLQALRMSMRGYATDAFNELTTLLSEEELNRFEQTYNNLKNTLEAEAW